MSSAALPKQPVHAFVEEAYRQYAMYVILDRALPHLADGLKPVQRRIIYAMSELGLKHTAKHKKSARTIGDVLGKYHPHGDSACYEAMVLMAQAFSYRYPFVDGQGNWGAPDDPKSFAAMRYTEARLSPYAQSLLAELAQGTVTWTQNFDGTLQEPKLLPAQVPNVLLNGASGIAVGMATDIPPHNLREVVTACIHLLKHPKATLAKIMEMLPGPDFPTGAEIITPQAEIAEIYKTGTGSIKLRAVYEKDGQDIIITALPYQSSGAKILTQIAQQMQAKKLPMVIDLRDESDHENPTRLVIGLRSNRVNTDELMSHLFATTDCERSYRVNLNMIGLDGNPQVKNLLTLLNEWLGFRRSTVTARLEHSLEKINKRLHILAGLMVAYLNIDAVITIIRENDQPGPVLMKRFKLSETQAEAILDLKLRHLAKLEETQIQGEENELKKEQANLKKTLACPETLDALIATELQACADTHGDDRRAVMVEATQAKAMNEAQLMPRESMTVILSEKGWIRAGKGHDLETDNLSFKSGDQLLATTNAHSHLPVIVCDHTGRSYSVSPSNLPSARSHGAPLTGMLKPPSGARFVGLVTGPMDQTLLLASDAGYGFVTQLENLIAKNSNGKHVLKCPEGAKQLPPLAINDLSNNRLAVITREGRLLCFPCQDLPSLAKGKGNKIIQIPTAKFNRGEDAIAHMVVLGPDDALQLARGKQTLMLKAKDLQHYVGERGRRGLKLPRGMLSVDCVTVKPA